MCAPDGALWCAVSVDRSRVTTGQQFYSECEEDVRATCNALCGRWRLEGYKDAPLAAPEGLAGILARRQAVLLC